MAGKRVVVVTGVAGYWGHELAARLLEQEGLHLIGLDSETPQAVLPRLDFIQADLRNPVLMDLLRQENVETVVHAAFRLSLNPRESVFEQNVMGTAKLLAACAEAGVRQVVMPSSLMAYGARPDNPMFLREDHPLNAPKKYGYLRDWVENDKFAEGFREQNPDIAVTLLRFGHIVGKRVDSPMTRFLRQEDAITLLGFDPMLQVIHEQDVLGALVHAAMGDYSGTFNVAPERGMPLWKLLGLSRKLPVPVLHPLAYWSVSVGGPRLAPMPLDYLRYPCMGDMARMRDVLGFVPQYTPEETAREFATQQRLVRVMGRKSREALDSERLRDTIERRQRVRELDEGGGTAASDA